MELNERVSNLETDVRDVRDRLARVESKLDTFATKADLFDALNAQTWRFVTFVCGFGTALVAATYFFAKHA
jgi:tetrahydromethanopterin S-methyltransferase subunit B